MVKNGVSQNGNGNDQNGSNGNNSNSVNTNSSTTEEYKNYSVFLKHCTFTRIPGNLY